MFSINESDTGIVPLHAARESLDRAALESKNPTVEHRWIGRHAPGEAEAGALMRTNESGLRRIARRSATLVKLQVRKRQKPAHPGRLGPAGPFERFLGWCVHGYTALGLVAAGLIAVLLVQGGPGCVSLVVFC